MSPPQLRVELDDEFFEALTEPACCDNTASTFRNTDMDWQAIWLSVRLALCTTAVLLVIGLPLAYWLTFSNYRWKFLAEAVVALPLVLPPTVLGFYVLLAIGPRSPVGAL